MNDEKEHAEMTAACASQRLEGRRILITGAASGIGRAIAEMFAGEGAALFLIDLDQARLKSVSESLGASYRALDLADFLELELAVNQAAEQIGGLDGVVNCAGLGQSGPIETVELAKLQQVTAINLIAPYLICKAALPHIRQAGGGTIVNIASGQGLLPNSANTTAYAATKGGLIAFSKSLAAEAAPAVRVNAVCPGITNTQMAAPLFAGYEDPTDAPWVRQYALQRIAEPGEIASAVLFLTSAESSYITGSAIAVDGGRCFH